MIIYNLFFELIRVALGKQRCLSITPSEDEWGKLYEIAEKQSLVGICYAGVQNLQVQGLTIPEELYLQWLSTAVMIQQRNEYIKDKCKELNSILSDYGVKSSILKGAGLASYYGELAGLRQSGDIDVYIDCGLEKSVSLAKRFQDKVDWDYKHLHLNVFKDVDLELHYKPEVILHPCRNKILQDIFQRPEVNASIFEKEYDGFVIPSLGFSIAHSILHIFQHYCYSGVGFRQILDCYFLLSHSSQQERMFAMNILARLKIKWFVKGLMWILVEKMGMSADVMLCEQNEKEGIILYDKIIISGNFGKYDNLVVKKGKIYSTYRLLVHNSKLALRHPSVFLGVPLYYMWVTLWKLCYSLKIKN